MTVSNEFGLRDIPHWFVSVFALTYITGFLIDNLYYSSVGINYMGEVIKLRDIQLGLIFLILFFIVTIPVFFLIFGRKKMAILGVNTNELPPMKTIMAINAFLYFGTIYYVVVFVPPGYFYFLEHPYRLASFFILISSVVIGYIIFTGILARRRRKIQNNKQLTDQERANMLVEINSRNENNQHIFLYLILVYVLTLDYLIFEPMIPELVRMLYPYGIFFFFFCFLFAAQLFRIIRRLEIDGANMTRFARVGFIVIAGLGLLVLYYTTVAAFAYTIFPHIPSVRGGADYKNAPSVTVVVEDATLIKNSVFVPADGQLQNLVLLYSTSDSLFFGSCEWRKGPGAILEIKRDEVKYLASAPTGSIPDCRSIVPATTKPAETPLPPAISPEPPPGSGQNKP